MTAATRVDTRIEPPLQGNERETLDKFLDYHRDTLLRKIEGLADDELKLHSVLTTNLTLLGLVRHMTEVERGWFGQICGEDDAWIYSTEDNPDGDFDDVAEADAQADIARYRGEVEKFRAALPHVSLDVVKHGRHDRDFSLRWIMCHMIEEYARHNGHADLLREAIDGETGE